MELRRQQRCFGSSIFLLIVLWTAKAALIWSNYTVLDLTGNSLRAGMPRLFCNISNDNCPFWSDTVTPGMGCDFGTTPQPSGFPGVGACSVAGVGQWYRTFKFFRYQFDLEDLSESDAGGAEGVIAQSKCIAKASGPIENPSKAAAVIRSPTFTPLANLCQIYRLSFWVKLSPAPDFEQAHTRDAASIIEQFYLEVLISNPRESDVDAMPKIWGSVQDYMGLTSSLFDTWQEICVDFSIDERFEINLVARHPNNCSEPVSKISVDSIQLRAGADAPCVTVPEDSSPDSSSDTTGDTDGDFTTDALDVSSGGESPEPGISSDLEGSTETTHSMSPGSSNSGDESTEISETTEPDQTSTASSSTAADLPLGTSSPDPDNLISTESSSSATNPGASAEACKIPVGSDWTWSQRLSCSFGTTSQNAATLNVLSCAGWRMVSPWSGYRMQIAQRGKVDICQNPRALQ